MSRFFLAFAVVVVLPLLIPACKYSVCNQAQPSADPVPPQKEAEESVLVVETETFRLFYPQPFTEVLPLEALLEHVQSGIERVEALLGPFEQRIDIYVPYRIVPEDPNFPENLVIQGVTFVDRGQITVAISLRDGDIGTFAHEFTHARLRDMGLTPPDWLEEGLAHYTENNSGFHQDLHGIVQREGPLSVDLLGEEMSDGSLEMRRRATGWAVVYYLIEVEGYTFTEIAHGIPLTENTILAASTQ